MGEWENRKSVPDALGHLLVSTNHIADRAWAGLYSFLTGQSLLILAWAAILAVTPTTVPARALVLLAISVVGVAMGIQWTLLGTRMWQYHLEYAKRLRSLTHQFTIENEGPGSTVWRDVDGVIDAFWRDGKDLQWLKVTSGNQIVLFSVPLFLALIHMVMYSVVIFAVVEWPTSASWPPNAMFWGGWAGFVWLLSMVWRICKSILKEPAFGQPA